MPRMTEEITIEVGDLHGEIYESLSEGLGEDFDAQLRDDLENMLHEYHRRVERSREAEGEEAEVQYAEDVDADGE